MGKSHRTRDEYEVMRGKIRELQKENKRLKQELANQSKRQYPRIEKQEELPKNELICASCGKGKLEIIDIVGRIFSVCDLCKDRKKL